MVGDGVAILSPPRRRCLFSPDGKWLYLRPTGVANAEVVVSAERLTQSRPV